MSSIEWTDETWNPTVGCSKVSPGCDGCYAIGVAHRAMQPAHQGLTIRRPGERPDWTGEVRCLPDRLDTPLRWRKPRRVFVDSMSDLFHPDVMQSFRLRVWETMAATPQHTYQVLTKRPRVMRGSFRNLDGWTVPLPTLPNVWLGTSIESDLYTFRANYLRETPAAVRFLSLEPLLGPLPSLNLDGIDWVIVGGESGPGARPMHPAWVRDLRDRCVEAGVAFFFKQWGAWRPGPHGDWTHRVERDGSHWPRPSREALDFARTMRDATGRSLLIEDTGWHGMTNVGKHAAGRVLDARTWDEMPAAAS